MNSKSNKTERDKIAERLKEARFQSGLSQESAAKKLGIPRPSISEIESGKRKVSAEEIIQFSNIYKVSTSWLLNEEQFVNDSVEQRCLINTDSYDLRGDGIHYSVK